MNITNRFYQRLYEFFIREIVKFIFPYLIFHQEEIALHQLDIEKLEIIGQNCPKLKILLLQNNLIPKIGFTNFFLNFTIFIYFTIKKIFVN